VHKLERIVDALGARLARQRDSTEGDALAQLFHTAEQRETELRP